MKKLSKLLLAAVCFATLSSGVAFAKDKDNKGPSQPQFHGREMPGNRSEKNGPDFRPGDNKFPFNPCFMPEIIAKVCAVDTTANTLTISDLDGKESLIYVSPFTHIIIDDPKEPKTIADIKKDNWIKFTIYNTGTENKLADRIIVKSN